MSTPEVRSHTKRPGEPRCAHPKCRNAVSARDFCQGCKSYVCAAHCTNPMYDAPFPHAAADHWSEMD